MTCRTVTANGFDFRFCPEPAPPAADRTRAIVYSRIVDELTGRPVQSRLSVTTTRTDLHARVADGGIVGLVCNPARTFPGLSLAAVDLDLTVSAQRFLPRRLTGSLGPIPGYPDAFDDLDLGDVALHRAALTLRGRVTRNNGLSREPLAGAEVEIIGIWNAFPPADVDPNGVMDPANLVALSPGIYADRTPGVDQVRHRGVVLAAGEEKSLLAHAAPGHRTVQLSDRVNLNPGDVLAFEPGAQALAEYVPVTGVDGAATPDQPATIELTYALARNHRPGTVAVRATPQAPAVANELTRGCIPGDRSLFTDGTAGLVDGAVAEISGSGLPEYQAVNFYRSVSDVDGYFRLPPLARVAQLRLRTSRADLPLPQIVDFGPDYDFAEARLDVVFP